MAKDEDYKRMVHTTRWLTLRKAVLTRHPVCESCEKDGRLTPAVEVHHIVPVETALTYMEKQNLMFDPHNLMALCHNCHVSIHMSMGKGTKANARERSREKADAACRKLFDEDGGGFF